MPTGRATSPDRRRTRRNYNSPRKATQNRARQSPARSPARSPRANAKGKGKALVRANSGKALARANSGRFSRGSGGSVPNSAFNMYGRGGGRPSPPGSRPGSPRPGSPRLSNGASGSGGGGWVVTSPPGKAPRPPHGLQRTNSTRSNASSASTVFYDAPNQIQKNIVERWQAKTAKYAQARKRNAVINSITARWTGQPAANIRATRRQAARNRWKRAISAALPSRAKLTDTVIKFHDFLDSAAKAQNYPNLCRMLQAQMSVSILAYYQKFKQFMVVDQTRYIGAAAVGRQCLSAAGLGIAALYAAPLAGWVLLKGWDAACDKVKAVASAQRAIRDVVMRSVDGPMTAMWRGLGNASAWALPALFDRFVKDKLREWVSNVSPPLAAAIRPEAIAPALRAHRDTIGGFLVGKDVDLLPALVAVSKALDACVVRAVIANFLPHQPLAPECRARA